MGHEYYTGWDIGGAHLKYAVVNKDGSLLKVEQVATPVWQGIDVLDHALQQQQSHIPRPDTLHAVTTTAELTDIFPNRETGLTAIGKSLQQCLQDAQINFYAGPHGWCKYHELQDQSRLIASANWHATGSYAASVLPDGIVIDVGSTTTDIIPFESGKLLTVGYTDYERLAEHELVYTGIVRTPVMVIAETIELEGSRHPVIPEYFATMADVYRLTGELDESDDMMVTADAGDKTVPASARRLARVIGSETDGSSEIEKWKHVAWDLARCHVEKISQSLDKIIARSNMRHTARLIGAGAGRFLVRIMAQNKGYDYIDYADLFSVPANTRPALARAATAVALAHLARLSD